MYDDSCIVVVICLDCPSSGPGPVWALFADPGPGPVSGHGPGSGQGPDLETITAVY